MDKGVDIHVAEPEAEAVDAFRGRVQRHAGKRGDVGVAGGVNHDLGADGLAAGLGLDNDSAHGAILDDGAGGPCLHQQFRPGTVQPTPATPTCRAR